MTPNKVEIRYKQAKFGHRILANILDFIFFAIAFILILIANINIMAATPTYNKNQQTLNKINVDSGLYVANTDGELLDIVTYCKVDKELSDDGRIIRVKMAIKTFDEYLKNNAEKPAIHDNFRNDIEELVLKVKVGTQNLYSKDETTGEIIRNQDIAISKSNRYKQVFIPMVDNICRGYLETGIPEHLACIKYFSKCLFFIELPIAYLLSGILIYFVPTLIFRRGRKTFGKAIYHVGVVDSKLLNPKFGRSLARFAIFYFGILILSVFTLGVPAIISISMMSFSKNKQSFPDYMLGLYEVDTSDNKIFNDYDEIALDDIKHDKTPIDFQMKRME